MNECMDEWMMDKWMDVLRNESGTFSSSRAKRLISAVNQLTK